jgi:hypothetical protein
MLVGKANKWLHVSGASVASSYALSIALPGESLLHFQLNRHKAAGGAVLNRDLFLPTKFTMCPLAAYHKA